MGHPPTPQSTPPADTMPQLRAAPQPKPAERKDSQDAFMDMLQGLSVTLHLGPRHYTLPIALLCPYSNYFRTEILRLIHSSGMGSKKRKLNDGTNSQEEDDWQSHQLHLVLSDDIDHASFALFVRFMYTGQYHAGVDASPKRAPPAATTHTPLVNGAKQPLPRAGKVSSINKLNQSITAAPPLPPATAIPPSIHAYMLAHRLHALSFMNHALTRIYHGIGTYFALTPHLIDFVWRHTPSIQTPSSTPLHPQTLSTSPLRTLLLDILITHWPSAHAHIVARDQQMEWSAVFEAHAELRKTLIFGMQMGGSKVRECKAYLAGGAEVFGKLRMRGVERDKMVDGEKGESEAMGGGEQEQARGEEKEVQMAKGDDWEAAKIEGEEKEE